MRKSLFCFLLVAVGWLACSSPPAPRPGEEAVERPAAPGHIPVIKKLAVLGFPAGMDAAQTDLVLAALSKGIQKSHKLEVVSGPELQRAVWGGHGEGPPQKCLDDFNEALRDGVKALDRFQLSGAGERLARAQSLLETCGVYLEQGQLVGLMVATGRLLLVREQRDDALSSFRQAVVFSPALDARSANLTDRAASVFEEARRAVLSGTAFRVSFGSWPPGATVFIDGKPRGNTPLSVTDLYGGIHFLRLEMQGHAGWTQVLPDAVPPEKIEVKLTAFFRSERLREFANELTEGNPGPEAAREMAQLAANLEVDGVLLVGFYREGSTLELGVRLFFVGNGSFTTPRRYSLGGSEKAWVATAQGLAATLRELKAASGEKDKAKYNKKKKKKKAG